MVCGGTGRGVTLPGRWGWGRAQRFDTCRIGWFMLFNRAPPNTSAELPSSARTPNSSTTRSCLSMPQKTGRPWHRLRTGLGWSGEVLVVWGGGCYSWG